MAKIFIKEMADILYQPFLFLLLLPSSLFSSENDPDVRLFRTINNNQSAVQSSFFSITDKSSTPLILSIPAALSGYGLIESNSALVDDGILILAADGLAYGIRAGIKAATRRNRPFEELPGVHVSNIESADSYSFPSGHAVGAFTLATVVTARHPEWYIGVPAFAWAGMISYGRIYFGLHYPTDVLAGSLIGIGSGILIHFYQKEILQCVRQSFGKSNEGIIFVVPQDGGIAAYIQVRF